MCLKTGSTVRSGGTGQCEQRGCTISSTTMNHRYIFFNFFNLCELITSHLYIETFRENTARLFLFSKKYIPWQCATGLRLNWQPRLCILKRYTKSNTIMWSLIINERKVKIKIFKFKIQKKKKDLTLQFLHSGTHFVWQSKAVHY